MDKATRAQVKRHNRRLVMRALFEEQADNRAALAVETGLTKPTIGTIVAELIENGYVTEDGYGASTSSGGKRPTILRFLKDSRQVIGVSIHADEIIAGLANLDGTLLARHHTALLPDASPVEALQATINALFVQSDTPVLCIGIGVPGTVNDEGLVLHSPVSALGNIALAEEIEATFHIPTYVSNNTALITRMQVKESQQSPIRLVTVSIGDVIEIGSSYGGGIYQHGEDISQYPIPGTDDCYESLHWQAVKQEMLEIANANPGSVLNSRRLSYLLLRRAVHLNESAALQMQDRLADGLAHLYRWIIGLMRPSEIVLTGSMSLLGQRLLETVESKLREQIPDRTLSQVNFVLAQSEYLSLQGAVVFGLQEELGIV